jgi:hypothetical protein
VWNGDVLGWTTMAKSQTLRLDVGLALDVVFTMTITIARL